MRPSPHTVRLSAHGSTRQCACHGLLSLNTCHVVIIIINNTIIMSDYCQSLIDTFRMTMTNNSNKTIIMSDFKVQNSNK